MIVIIEGAEFASALSTYLKTCYEFELISYEPPEQSFVTLLDKIVFKVEAPRLVICKAHITALAKGLITVAYFKEFEAALALTRAKLVLAVSETDTINSGFLADGYAHSWLNKRMFSGEDTTTGLLDWLEIQPTWKG